ncbi:MAG: alpha/beta fold hydrolase [Roseobacter sp.]|uniref:alpha/beta fold hydrolase n=1 Tax=Tateyamaria sp. TaxID=1929288 RepID=UPI003295708C
MHSQHGFHLEVSDGHKIWVETKGSPNGVPALFLHGGPGSGCNASQQALFDPEINYAIFVDQRGAGRSLPHAERHANTTKHLIDDLEAVRSHLCIDHWLVIGGSWGATLGLAYAISHPARVTGMILRATFLGTEAELKWAFCTALESFHPNLYSKLLHEMPDGLKSLWCRILDPDPKVYTTAARTFSVAERAMSELVAPSPKWDGPLAATAFMEAHYFLNDCFLKPDELLSGATGLAGIPGIVIHARYDLLCPPKTASSLVAAWPGSRLLLIEGAGHSLGHAAVFEAVRDSILELSYQA